MQNDTISRSALIAELEGFKVSTGDPVIRLIIDRIISIVKDRPDVELPEPQLQHLSEIPSLEERSCDNCLHFDLSASDYPCYKCHYHREWVSLL